MGKNGVKPRDDELWPPTVFEPFAEWLESPSTSRSGRKRQREPLTGAKLREAPPDGHWPKMARTPDEQLGRERWWKERSHVPKGLSAGFQKTANSFLGERLGGSSFFSAQGPDGPMELAEANFGRMT